MITKCINSTIEDKLTEAFLSRYVGRDETCKPESVTPDVGMSLDHWEKISGLESHISYLDDSPLCLLEGYSTATNGSALKAFLSRFGVQNPRIQAIDLLNVGDFFEQQGIPLPNVEFFQADANDLASLYSNAAVDLIIQDFILNCAPFSSHESIMCEAHRVLKPGGIILTGITDDLCVQTHKRLKQAELAKKYDATINVSATSLLNLFGENSIISHEQFTTLRDDLSGSVLADEANRQYTYVTQNGVFEFFTPFSNFKHLCERVGFVLLGANESKGIDSNGMSCIRRRLLLQKAPVK